LDRVQTKAAKAVLGLSIVSFVTCLTQDGYYIDDSNPKAWSPAWGLLVFGWMGLLSGTFAWLANPLLFGSWVLLAMSKYRVAFYLSLGALLFAVSFLLHSEVISSTKPSYSKIVGYGIGYWLWIASALILAVGAGVLSFRSKLRQA
jgi:hypothetical protein